MWWFWYFLREFYVVVLHVSIFFTITWHFVDKKSETESVKENNSPFKYYCKHTNGYDLMKSFTQITNNKT